MEKRIHLLTFPGIKNFLLEHHMIEVENVRND